MNELDPYAAPSAPLDAGEPRVVGRGQRPFPGHVLVVGSCALLLALLALLVAGFGP